MLELFINFLNKFSLNCCPYCERDLDVFDHFSEEEIKEWVVKNFDFDQLQSEYYDEEVLDGHKDDSSYGFAYFLNEKLSKKNLTKE